MAPLFWRGFALFAQLSEYRIQLELQSGQAKRSRVEGLVGEGFAASFERSDLLFNSPGELSQ